MIDFNKITTPYLTGKITFEQWIDNMYEEFVRVIEEMIEQERKI